MPKTKNAKADKAFALYRQGWKLSEIAAKLDVPAGTVRRWKHDYKWDSKRSESNTNANTEPGANVRKGPGAPKGSHNALKHGLYSRYFSSEDKDLLDAAAGMDPIDMLWDQIQIAYATILLAQKRISESKDANYAAFLTAQAREQAELRNLIKQYDEMVHHDWMLATEEQKARIAVLRAKAQNGAPDEEIADDGFLSALEGMAAEDWSGGNEAG